jgi:hypothetical protein
VINEGFGLRSEMTGVDLRILIHKSTNPQIHIFGAFSEMHSPWGPGTFPVMNQKNSIQYQDDLHFSNKNDLCVAEGD